ncbi:cytochrome P450 4C1-like isoform X2 [Leptopilina boulardi]|nr:cytochrome P450 4C1-like isoform X2 [Leptopilina boulardi]XP_051173161.1 cytochrome P450 4C1-like isoform X2 [Leptopilina boulardi]
MRILHTYPSPSRLWMGKSFWINVYDADQIQSILTKLMEKGSFYKFSKPWLGNGLAVGPESIWHYHRKFLRPAFSINVLRPFLQVFQKHSKILTENLSVKLDGNEFQILPYVVDACLDITLETTAGVSKYSKANYAKYSKEVSRVLDLMLKRGLSFWLYPDVIYKLTKNSQIFNESVQFLRNTTLDIIKQKRMELLQTDKNVKDETESDEKKSFLEFVIKLADNDKKFTDTDIIDECNNLLAAGNDTISSALQFTLLILASLPEVQEAVYQELYNIFGNESPESIAITTDILARMDYTERVIKESMRLFPPLPIILRQSVEDVQIDDYIYPKNSTIFIVISKIHRDEKYWPDPLKFDPDRFLPEKIAERHSHAYLPFSAGPRNCIGFAYAIMEMKIILATLLYRQFLRRRDQRQHQEMLKTILYGHRKEIQYQFLIKTGILVIEEFKFKWARGISSRVILLANERQAFGVSPPTASRATSNKEKLFATNQRPAFLAPHHFHRHFSTLQPFSPP